MFSEWSTGYSLYRNVLSIIVKCTLCQWEIFFGIYHIACFYQIKLFSQDNSFADNCSWIMVRLLILFCMRSYLDMPLQIRGCRGHNPLIILWECHLQCLLEIQMTDLARVQVVPMGRFSLLNGKPNFFLKKI